MEWFLFVILILAVGTLAVSVWEVTHFQVVSYCVSTDKIEKDHRFVFLVDLHSCRYGKKNAKLVKAIRDLKPEAILIGGDLLVGTEGESGETAIELLEQLAGQFSVYYVNGNHESRMKEDPEYYGDGYGRYLHKLRMLGIENLNDCSVPYPGDSGLQLSGVELDGTYYKKVRPAELTVETMQEKLGEPDPSRFQLLLAHTPAFSKAYAGWGADLVLCGHYHGGIVGLPGNRGLISTQYKLFEPYSKGCFPLKTNSGEASKQMIVSAGLGTHTIKFRFCNPQQLVCLDLKRD